VSCTCCQAVLVQFFFVLPHGAVEEPCWLVCELWKSGV
jgi:hypothetical protein